MHLSMQSLKLSLHFKKKKPTHSFGRSVMSYGVSAKAMDCDIIDQQHQYQWLCPEW
jgi:hypothetical protein